LVMPTKKAISLVAQWNKVAGLSSVWTYENGAFAHSRFVLFGRAIGIEAAAWPFGAE